MGRTNRVALPPARALGIDPITDTPVRRHPATSAYRHQKAQPAAPGPHERDTTSARLRPRQLNSKGCRSPIHPGTYTLIVERAVDERRSTIRGQYEVSPADPPVPPFAVAVHCSFDCLSLP